MNFSFKNTTALITGSSQGIGLDVARQFARLGANVIITSNDQKSLKASELEIKKITPSVLAILADATKETEISRVAEQALSRFGKIHILINNVGSIGRIASFEQLNNEDWQDLFELNVMSGVLFTKKLLPAMKLNSSGRIIFLSSEKAVEPGVFMSHYSMTKAAVLSIAKSLANELGKYGITVNCVSPGVIPTPSWDLAAVQSGMTREAYAAQFCRNVFGAGQLGGAEDVAALVTFLCSEHARWITGSNLRIDGGSVQSINI
jgi:3-oxoacyl-[acyl-carrier protein] reductase